jgi:hypothetical protein
MLDFVQEAAVVVGALPSWYLDQALPVQVIAGIVSLTVLWVIWVVLRLTLGALRGTFRGL